MTAVRPIIFGPGDKLRWLEAVAFHPSATGFHARLAIALSNRIDKHVGTATIGQQWLATAVHATERGVRKALLEMEARQLVVATRPAMGRGKATVYRPLTPMLETRNGGSGERRNAEGQKEEHGSWKGGTVVPILPKSHLNSSCPTIGAGDPNSLTWQSVKGKLKASLGNAIVEAWFDRLAVTEITASEVVMTCPTKFVRHYIEQHLLYGGLLAGWRRVLPNINSVRLVEAREKAAE